MLDTGFISEIYEAAVAHETWQAVLAKLSVMAGAAGASLLVFRPGRQGRAIAMPSVAGAIDDFLTTGSSMRNVRPERSLQFFPMGFATDREVCTDAELAVDPVCMRYMYSYGYQWSAGTVIPTPSSDVLAFDLVRKKGSEPFERSAMDILDRYRPHLARAALLAHRLELRVARSIADALETVGLPAAVLAASGKVLSANPLLEGLSETVIVRAFDKLMLAPASANQLLAQAIAALSAEAAPTVRSIPIPAGEATKPLVAHLVPLVRSATDVFGSAAAFLIVTPVVAPEAPMTEVLTGLFDLTPAEARVAKGVALGRTVDELARTHALSIETVRSQLKAAMAKTGTSRQIELALLLAGGRLPPHPSH